MKLSHDVLTLAELARYLKVAEKTVHRLIRRREIPCIKVAGQWRFVKSVIDDWISTNLKARSKDEATLVANSHGSKGGAVSLTPFLRKDYVLMDIKEGDKEAVLSQLSAPLSQAGLLKSHQAFVQKLLRREKLMSTALGQGVAIPHLRNPKDNPEGSAVLVIGLCRQGVDFEALDGQKTRLFFLLCANSEVLHLRVLAKLNRILLCDDTVDKLVLAQGKAEVLNILLEEEKKLNEVQKAFREQHAHGRGAKPQEENCHEFNQ